MWNDRHQPLLSPCYLASVLHRTGRRHRSSLSLYLSWRIRCWTGWWISRRWLVVVSRRWILHKSLLCRVGACSYDLLIRRLASSHDHSPGCTIAVVRATGTAAAGCDGNDDGEEDYGTNYSACNASSRPNTWISTVAIAAYLVCTTLVIVRAVNTIFSADSIIATGLEGRTVGSVNARRSTS